jgi:hypothetical protein
MDCCPLQGFCQQLVGCLRDLQVATEAIDETCAGLFPCAAILENSRVLFQHADAQNAALLSTFVAKMFLSNPIECTDTTADYLLNQQPFRCPELEIEIYQPCQTRSCCFWTANSWTRNCILEYRVTHACDLLGVTDLAIILGLGDRGAKQQLQEAIVEAQYWALKNKLATTPVPASTFPPFPPDHAFHESVAEATIRSRFSIAPLRVLLIAVESFASLKAACAAVDVPPERFLALCQQYGINAVHLI